MRVSPHASSLTIAACTAVALAATVPSTAFADDGPKARRVQVVLVNFTDSSFSDPSKARDNVKESFFGKTKSLTSYYNDVTRGATTFKPAAAGKDGILGPVTIDMAAGCNTNNIYNLTLKAVEQQGFTWGKDFEHLSLIFPGSKAGCGFGGLGSVSGGITWIPTDDGNADQTLLSHEFGHNFGYPHQTKIRCADMDLAKCEGKGENSRKTPMGGGSVAVGLSAPELLHSKWLSDAEAPKVTKSQTYTLQSLYGGGKGVRALIVPAGKDSLVVEMRSAHGTLDTHLQGVHVYRVQGGNYAGASLVDTTPDADHSFDSGTPDADAIAVGKTLTDKANRVEIKVVKSQGGTATVAVGLDGVPAAAEQAAGGNASGKPSQAPASQAGPSDATHRTDGPVLAETGADSTNPLPLVAGGVALFAVGAGFFLKFRRRRALDSARHAR